MSGEGAQQERKVQRYRMQKERRMRMENTTGGDGTQQERRKERRWNTGCKHIKLQKHYGRKGDAAGTQG